MPGQGFIDGRPWFKAGKPVFGSGQGCGGERILCADYVTQFVEDHPDPLVTVPSFSNTGEYDCNRFYPCGPFRDEACFTDDPCTWIPGAYSMDRAFATLQWIFLLNDAAQDEENQDGAIECYDPAFGSKELTASALYLGIACGQDATGRYLESRAAISGTGDGAFDFAGIDAVIAWRERKYIGDDDTIPITALPPTVLPWWQEAEAWDIACDGREAVTVDW